MRIILFCRRGIQLIDLAHNFCGCLSVIGEIGRSKTVLSRPFIAFHPETTAQLGTNGTAHRQGDGSLLKVDELIFCE